MALEQTSTVDKVRENLRLQQVYNVFLHYGLDIAFERVATIALFRQKMQRWVWNLPDDLESPALPVKVRLMIEELGPTYVKVGQIVSSQASVVPPEWEEQLARLQSNVPPFPSDVVRQIIIDELGAPPEELFAVFDSDAFAAASTAQVHRATLHDGTEVVVKVQRPNIRNQMKADVGIMRNAARVLSNRSQALRAIDLSGMVDEFGSNAIRELDYTGEAYNSFRLTQNMAGIPGVHIPQIYPELSTDRVLTMEFIRGVKISNLAAIDEAGLDRKTLAQNALRAIVKQLLIDGFFHADPHPGNVLVRLGGEQAGEIAFIDTGMVGELELSQRLNIIQLLIAVTQNDVMGMASVMKSLSVPFVDKVDDKAYYKDFERTVGRAMISGGKADFGQTVNLAMDLLRRHGLRLDANLTLAIKALMQAQAIAVLLFPEGGIVADGVQMIREEALKAVTADRLYEEAKKQLTLVAREAANNLPSLSEATLGWLNQYRKGRFEVYVDTSGVAKEVQKVSQLGRQLVIALMVVGMVIGSAIATVGIGLGQFEGQYWTTISQIAVLGYIFSSLVAAVVVLRLLWRWLRGRPADKD
ncbi:MAG: AarF/ABC1/UbiB kinase family protein [Anaerolinea sp.]|nr:AarF/ABC1/UbiB kinase family protein [Anaerolinea sp.]